MARVYRDTEPITAKRAEWMPIMEAFSACYSTADLQRPPSGLAYHHSSGRTAYYTTTRYVRIDGSVRVYLKWCIPGYQTFTIGACIPAGDGEIEQHRIMRPPSLRGRSVVVFRDAQGLPYPVPVEAVSFA